LAVTDNMIARSLLQLRVLRFGLLQDGDVGVGVFPEGEEIFVGGECPDAGGIGIGALRSSRLQSVRASHSQMRQRSRPAVPDKAAVVENLLKLGSGGTALSGCQIGLTPHIHCVEAGGTGGERNLPQLNGSSVLQLLDGPNRILPVQRQLPMNRR